MTVKLGSLSRTNVTLIGAARRTAPAARSGMLAA